MRATLLEDYSVFPCAIFQVWPDDNYLLLWTTFRWCVLEVESSTSQQLISVICKKAIQTSSSSVLEQ